MQNKVWVSNSFALKLQIERLDLQCTIIQKKNNKAVDFSNRLISRRNSLSLETNESFITPTWTSKFKQKTASYHNKKALAPRIAEHFLMLAKSFAFELRVTKETAKLSAVSVNWLMLFQFKCCTETLWAFIADMRLHGFMSMHECRLRFLLVLNFF